LSPNPLTESREAVAAALEPLGVTVYGAPPEVVSPPAAVVLPGADWWKQVTYTAVQVGWNVTLMATMNGTNAAALERLERLVWDAVICLERIGQVGSPSTPRALKMGTVEVAATDLPVLVQVTTTEGA